MEEHRDDRTTWLPWQDAFLVDARAGGISSTAIATVLGFTRARVDNRVRRLKRRGKTGPVKQGSKLKTFDAVRAASDLVGRYDNERNQAA